MVHAMTKEGFAHMLAAVSRGIDATVAAEYWKTFETEGGRQGILELYRSGDFEKLEAYEGQLARLSVPTLVARVRTRSWGSVTLSPAWAMDSAVTAEKTRAARMTASTSGASVVVGSERTSGTRRAPTRAARRASSPTPHTARPASSTSRLVASVRHLTTEPS